MPVTETKDLLIAKPSTGGTNGGRGPGEGNGDGEWHEGWGPHGPPIASAKFAMMLACASSVMLFVALTGGYIIVRGAAAQWPPAGLPPLPSGLVVNTGIIIASSVAYGSAQFAIRRNRVAWLQGGTLLATALGAAFLARQIVVWNEFMTQGVTMSSGIYGSWFYVLTLVHALHVIGGLGAVSFVTVQAWRHCYSRERHLPVEVAGICWHFVGVLWLFLFTILYLL